MGQVDLKVSNSLEKINKNFANFENLRKEHVFDSSKIYFTASKNTAELLRHATL